MVALELPLSASNSCVLLRLVESYPLAAGCAGGVRFGYACPYKGEPRRSGPRGRAVGSGVQLGARCVAPRRTRPTRGELASCAAAFVAGGNKGPLAAPAGGQLPLAAAALSPYSITPDPAPVRRILSRTRAHPATYASIQTAAVAVAPRGAARLAPLTPLRTSDFDGAPRPFLRMTLLLD